MIPPVDNGGVEEKKDDSSMDAFSPPAGATTRNDSSNNLNGEDEGDAVVAEDDEHATGFQAQLHAFADAVFGSCGTAIEAAADFVQQQGCRWGAKRNKKTDDGDGQHDAKPPLSIADELRRLAAIEGRPFPYPANTRSADIPKFLGEDALDDDNISAISQHTLERQLDEAAYARRRLQRPPTTVPVPQPSNSSDCDGGVGKSSATNGSNPPSPTRTFSASSGSSNRNKREGRRHARTGNGTTNEMV